MSSSIASKLNCCQEIFDLKSNDLYYCKEVGLFWCLFRNVKTSGRFFQIFVAFSENLNFIAQKWVAGCAIEWPGFSMIPLLFRVWALEGWRPFRYNARRKSYSSKGCPFVLGCIERLVSPNRECAWRPTFAGSPLPARKFPSKRCHLPPPEKQPCSLVHSLVALLCTAFFLALYTELRR